MQQGDAVASLCFIEIGSGDEYCNVFAEQRIENTPEIAAGDRINAVRRFVEKNHLRCVYQGTYQSQLLLHSAGELSRKPFTERAHARGIKQAGCAPLPVSSGHAENTGVKTNILIHGQIFIETEALGHIADMMFDPLGVAAHIKAGNCCPPGTWCEHTGKHAQRSCFACAVGSNQTENFTGFHIEAQVVHGDNAGELHGQLIYFDGVAIITHKKSASCHINLGIGGHAGLQVVIGIFQIDFDSID